jgi:hypothetical protein
MTRPRPPQAQSRDLAPPWPGGLARLAGELAGCGIEARVVLAEPWLPYLEVREPGTVHAEKVYADRRRYVWSWGECIGGEAAAAAVVIAGLLGGGPGA